jgi:hypothetical protein
VGCSTEFDALRRPFAACGKLRVSRTRPEAVPGNGVLRLYGFVTTILVISWLVAEPFGLLGLIAARQIPRFRPIVLSFDLG